MIKPIIAKIIMIMVRTKIIIMTMVGAAAGMRRPASRSETCILSIIISILLRILIMIIIMIMIISDLGDYRYQREKSVGSTRIHSPDSG